MKVHRKIKRKSEDILKKDYLKVKIDLKDQKMKDIKLKIIQNKQEVPHL